MAATKKKRKTATKRAPARKKQRRTSSVRGATATAQVELKRIVRRYAETLADLGVADANFARKEPLRALLQFMAQEHPAHPLSKRSPYERCDRAKAIGQALAAMDRMLDEIEAVVQEMTTRPWVQKRIGYALRVWCDFRNELERHDLLKVVPPERLKRWQTMLLSQSINNNIASSGITCIWINKEAEGLLANFLKDRDELERQGHRLDISPDEFRILVWRGIVRNLAAIRAMTKRQFGTSAKKKRARPKRR